MTDADFMLAVLEDGPASTMELIRRSIAERGCGLTPHSRASELRAQGHTIVCTREGEHNGRGIYVYRLGELNATEAAPGSATPVALSTPRPGPSPQPATGHDDARANGGAAGSTDTHAVIPSLGPEQLTLDAAA